MSAMKSWLLSTIIATTVLTSCSSIQIASRPTISTQPLATVSQTVTLNASPTVSPTSQIILPKLPVPTISLDAQLKIVELLNTKDCVLPCYLSITPGTTTWKDAKSLLDAIGAEYTGQSQQGDMIWFGYGMHRGNATNVLNQNADSLFDLDLVVDDNGIVQQVFAWFLTHNAGHLLADYWTKNSPRNLFLQIGMPDAIYSTKTAGGLAVVYQKLGVVGIYDSLWNGSFLCPENETRLSNMSFMLTNTAFPLDIYPPNGKVTQYPSLWLPIEKTLHVSNQQFYNQVLSNPLVCFELRP